MREFDIGPSTPSLAGSLLISHPGLLDPNFRRTVIYLSAHDAKEGSFGLVLNRPSGQSVSDLLPDRDELGALGDVPVLLGGPVSADQLSFAAFEWQRDKRRFECRHHIDIEEAQSLLESGDAAVRAFVGYAGWGKGQLEGELAQKAWLLAKPEEDLLSLPRAPRLWKDLLGSFGPWFRLVADAPEDVSGN